MKKLSKPQEAVLLQAEHLLAAGQAQAAAQTISPLVQQAPRLVRAQVILARALRDLDQSDLALARFKAAAEASSDPARWQELVIELLKAGQKSRARAMAKKAPVKGPQKKALLDLAKTGLKATGLTSGGVAEGDLHAVKALVEAGQLGAAQDKANALLSRHPKSAYLHNILGICYLSQGDAQAAETHFRTTLQLSPDFTGTLSNLGLSLTLQDKLEEAIRILRQAVSNDPAAVDARTNLANAHLKANDFEQAEAQANKVLETAPDDLESLQIKTTALMKSQKYKEALDPLHKLNERLPGEPVVLAHIIRALEATNQDQAALDFAHRHKDVSPALARRYGALLAELGDIDQARAELREVLAEAPSDADAYLRYGAIGKWKADDPLYSRLRSFVESTDDHPRGLAYFALAKAEMDLNNDSECMRLLHLANQAQAKIAAFDLEKTVADFSLIKSNWSGSVLDDLVGAGVDSVAPIFVIGMPRSGSTLTEQILAAHPTIVGTGEDSVVSPFFEPGMLPEANKLIEAAKRGAAALRSVAKPDQRVVDKYLNNSLRLGALAAAFPNAVFVETIRDPRAIALSIYANPMRVVGHPYSTDLKNIAELFKLHTDLMSHWKGMLGNRIISITYENLVSDPEPNIRALIADAGLPWDDACLRPESVARRIKTLSYAQVRADIGTASSDRWRRFERDLEPFSKSLREAGLLDAL